MSNGFLIGCHHGMTESDVRYIHKKISDFFNKI